MTSTVSKWIPITDQLMLRRMGKTGEECAELTAVTTRITIQGIDEVDPGTQKTNRQRLIEEIADVYAQLDANVEMLGLDADFIAQRRARKLGYMREWEALFIESSPHAPQICGNCDTALPEGCGGLFRDDGPACSLNP